MNIWFFLRACRLGEINSPRFATGPWHAKAVRTRIRLTSGRKGKSWKEPSLGWEWACRSEFCFCSSQGFSSAHPEWFYTSRSRPVTRRFMTHFTTFDTL